MAKLNAPYTNFNGGEIGKEVQARINLDGYAATASIMENWLPEAEGPMGLRPGMQFMVQPTSNDAFVLLHPFRYSVSQKALLCFSDYQLRIAQNGAILSRGAVTSVIPNSGMNLPSASLALTAPTAGQAVASGALANLVDGDAASGIISGATATQTFTFDLGSAQSVNVATIFGPLTGVGSAPGDYTITASNASDMSGAVTVATITGSAAWAAGERRSHLFTAQTYRYWRLTITLQQDGGSGSYAFNGVQFNGSGWGDVSIGSATIAATGLFSNHGVWSAGAGGKAAMRSLVTTANVGSQHVLNVDVNAGPLSIRVGSTLGGSEYLSFTARTGLHSIAFVPTASPYYVEVSTTENVFRTLNAISIAPTGDLVLTTPWPLSVLRSLRFVQDGDVVYVASGVGRMKRIERRAAASWSIVDTDERGGPFLSPNLDDSYSMTPSATTGNITLTSSLPFFTVAHNGALFQLTQAGQTVADAITGVGQFTNSIAVRGINNDRIFRITISGTWTGTLNLQRSVGNDTAFANQGTTYTSNTTNTAFDDESDNQIIYYRIRASAWTSGTATISITYSGGTTIGVVRVTGVTSQTTAGAEVLETLGAATATTIWAEGAWSDAQYWPKAIALFDGRLWSGAVDRVWASRSDSYEDHTAGDGAADAIARNIATGDVNPIQSILSLSRLVFCTEGAEVAGRESTQDGYITGANLTLRDFGTQGSADVSPLKVDTQGVMIDRSTWRALLITDAESGNTYGPPGSLMRLHRNLGKPGIVQMAVSRQPETRLWMVRADGVLLTKAFSVGEAVLGWSRVITDGLIESVAVLPGDASVGEDEIWVMVQRTVNSVQRRYLEKLAPYYYDNSLAANRLDSSIGYYGAATNTFSLPHLKGRTVRVWGDGARLQDRVVDVSTGQITLEKSVSVCWIGLPYTARYRSSKLALGAQGGTALGQLGRTLNIIFGLLDSVPNLEFANNFDVMDWLPDRMLSDHYDSGPGLKTGESGPWKVPEKQGTLERNPMLCLRTTGPAPMRLQYFVLAHLLKERIG